MTQLKSTCWVAGCRSTSACPCSQASPMPKASPSAPKQENFLRWKRRSPIEANWCSSIMPTVAAAFAFRERGPISEMLRTLLPCCPMASIRYHGAPADLRDIPLGTDAARPGFFAARPEDFRCAGIASRQPERKSPAIRWHRHRHLPKTTFFCSKMNRAIAFASRQSLEAEGSRRHQGQQRA